MDRETLRKVQLAQLEIAKEIRRVCDENGINYFLDSGTLLGAVRHKGFIPWDDDMDLGMLRKDYDSFLEIAPKKLGDDYFLQTWLTDEEFGLSFAKVRKKGTVYKEQISVESSSHNELFVDVFAYDFLPDDKAVQKKQRRKFIMLKRSVWVKCRFKPWKRHSGIKKLLCFCKYVPNILYASIHSKQEMIEEYSCLITSLKDINANYFFSQGINDYGKWIVPKYCFDAFETLEFEGELFKVPSHYEDYLTNVYGDYMTLPPKDQRENRHMVIELKL